MLRKSGQPPAGIDPGTWDYLHEPSIAARYDAGLDGDRVVEADQQVLKEVLVGWPNDRRRIAVDFGCGTGRSTLQLVEAGFRVAALDLSEPMLQELIRKLEVEDSHRVALIQANLLDLRCLASESFELGLCLYSTLGMLRGRTNRAMFLQDACRVLKKGAWFIVHAHQVWWQLNFPGGLRCLAMAAMRSWIRRDIEFGDRFSDQVAIRSLPIRSFRLGELETELRAAGFRIEKVHPILDQGSSRSLLCRILGIRVHGWTLVCRRNAESPSSVQ